MNKRRGMLVGNESRAAMLVLDKVEAVDFDFESKSATAVMVSGQRRPISSEEFTALMYSGTMGVIEGKEATSHLFASLVYPKGDMPHELFVAELDLHSYFFQQVMHLDSKQPPAAVLLYRADGERIVQPLTHHQLDEISEHLSTVDAFTAPITPRQMANDVMLKLGEGIEKRVALEALLDTFGEASVLDVIIDRLRETGRSASGDSEFAKRQRAFLGVADRLERLVNDLVAIHEEP